MTEKKITMEYQNFYKTHNKYTEKIKLIVALQSEILNVGFGKRNLITDIYFEEDHILVSLQDSGYDGIDLASCKIFPDELEKSEEELRESFQLRKVIKDANIINEKRKKEADTKNKEAKEYAVYLKVKEQIEAGKIYSNDANME